MAVTNIMIAGVGGQGLVLTTDIIAHAAFLSGYDIKTNDVIGLSQRGGKVYGSIRFGEEVKTPIVPSGEIDILIGLEELETLRYKDEVKKDGIVLMNTYQIYPNLVLLEKEQYPTNILETIKSDGLNVLPLDTQKIATELGNVKVANTILIGALSKIVNIKEEDFVEAIKMFVPPKTLEANLLAFKKGRELFDNTKVQ